MLTGGCGGADAQVPPEAQKPRAPLAPTHALRGGRLAQLDCARRGQVCPAGGQTGYRGAPDPLYTYAANFHVGILQEQVCTLPPLANPGMPLTDRTRAVQILRSERQSVPGPTPTFPGGSGTFSARSARMAFVFLCCARDAEYFAYRGSLSVCVCWSTTTCPYRSSHRGFYACLSGCAA